jgi:hypothetical protein
LFLSSSTFWVRLSVVPLLAASFADSRLFCSVLLLGNQNQGAMPGVQIVTRALAYSAD